MSLVVCSLSLHVVCWFRVCLVLACSVAFYVASVLFLHTTYTAAGTSTYVLCRCAVCPCDVFRYASRCVCAFVIVCSLSTRVVCWSTKSRMGKVCRSRRPKTCCVMNVWPQWNTCNKMPWPAARNGARRNRHMRTPPKNTKHRKLVWDIRDQ